MSKIVLAVVLFGFLSEMAVGQIAARKRAVSVAVTNDGKEPMVIRLSDGPGNTLATFRLGAGRFQSVTVSTDEWVRCQAASVSTGLTGAHGRASKTLGSFSFRITQPRVGARPTVH